jgi:hypothetical protein
VVAPAWIELLVELPPTLTFALPFVPTVAPTAVAAIASDSPSTALVVSSCRLSIRNSPLKMALTAIETKTIGGRITFQSPSDIVEYR